MQKIHEAIIQRLQFLGEKCLTEARTNKTYTDQTGNLTSSIGYVILYEGRQIFTNGFEGEGEGSGKGRQLANDLFKNYGTGYALIVVAGMNYAAHVEARGYNVLASAEQLAEKELPKMLKALSRNIEKMK